MPGLAADIIDELSDRCVGTVDSLRRIDGRVELRGWALEVDRDTLAPVESLAVTDGRNAFEIDLSHSREPRDDIVDAYRLRPGSEPGFAFTLDAADINSRLDQIRVMVRCRNGSLHRLSQIVLDEHDDLDALHHAISTSESLPVPGFGTEAPVGWGMDPEPRHEFLAAAGEFVRMMARFGGLRPDHKFVDVGCGIGRIALGLTQYLAHDTPYVGFDIVAPGIDWARRHISGPHPNFEFLHLDLFNEFYNPDGRKDMGIFPEIDRDFDYALLGSVFTHMYFEDVEATMAEINRHLVTGGTMFATFFLINRESRNAIRLRLPSVRFALGDGVACFTEDGPPLHAVAFDEQAVSKLLHQSGFELVRSPIYGNWTGTRTCPSYQDALIARKTRDI